MKKPILVALVYGFFLSFQAYSSDYSFGTTLNGGLREFFGEVDKHCKFIKVGRRDKAFWTRLLAKTERQLLEVKTKIDSAKKGNHQYNVLIDDFYKLLNNKAHCYIFLNRIDESLAILLDLEKKLPGESKFAENLAFCYEKKRNYAKALQWIQLAIKRNSMAAYSNVWVYEKILYARLQLVKDPDYLKKNDIFNLGIDRTTDLAFISQRTEEEYRKRWRLSSKTKHIKQRIQLQLQRNPQSKDPVIASMIFELATIYAIDEVCEVALPVFELALEHNPANEDLVKRRIRQMKKIIAANEKSLTDTRPFLKQVQLFSLVISILIVVVVLGSGTYWWARRKKKTSKR